MECLSSSLLHLNPNLKLLRSSNPLTAPALVCSSPGSLLHLECVLELYDQCPNGFLCESLQFFWLDLVVVVHVDLTEGCIDELVREWGTDAIFGEELCQKLAELFHI